MTNDVKATDLESGGSPGEEPERDEPELPAPGEAEAMAATDEDASPEEGGAEGGERPAVSAAELDALRDRLLRVSAEFDNYRKRTERERREIVERAAEGVLSDLLPIVDDFERALAVEPDESAVSAYRAGVELIHRQLLDLLARRGVTPIEALGQDFDPHLHQAVATEPVTNGHRDGEIVEELRRGYRLGDRLLRPSIVKVAKA